MSSEDPTGRRLLLLRHATARYDDPDVGDREAPLSELGRDAALRLGEYISLRGHRPTHVLCSPARRTRETFECLASRLDELPVLQVEPALYLASPRVLRRHIAAAAAGVGSLLVIAHNPGIAALAYELAARAEPTLRERIQASFPPAALAVFGAQSPAWSGFEAQASLLDFVCPTDLPPA